MIAIDRKSQKALHRQIYDAFRKAIVEGNLRAKQRVPSTRMLAAELGISRFPAITAYSQLLSEGYLESRVGSGTVICSSLPERFLQTETVGKKTSSPLHGLRPFALRTSPLASFETPQYLKGLGPFGVGQVAYDEFPLQVWSSLVARCCRKMNAQSFHYGDQMGSISLRREIAIYLRAARSVRCEAEQVMIVNGSQQALEISTRVLMDRGTSVWIEEPGYHLGKAAFALNECQLIPVPVDEEGLDVAEGIKRCPAARVASVVPSHQFPLGATMSAQRRLQLLEWAERSGSWIIEDDYDSEYRYDASPIASLQGLDVNARVIYIGTFSKVLFPSLRIGYIVVPLDLVDRFLTVRRAMDFGHSTFEQDVLTEFIREGHFARHIRRMRVLYRQRRTALVESIGKELGSTVRVCGSEAGLHLTVALPSGSNDVEIAQRAGRQSLWMWPLSSCYLGKAEHSGLILGFGNSPIEDIPAAIRKLRKLITSR